MSSLHAHQEVKELEKKVLDKIHKEFLVKPVFNHQQTPSLNAKHLRVFGIELTNFNMEGFPESSLLLSSDDLRTLADWMDKNEENMEWIQDVQRGKFT